MKPNKALELLSSSAPRGVIWRRIEKDDGREPEEAFLPTPLDINVFPSGNSTLRVPRCSLCYSDNPTTVENGVVTIEVVTSSGRVWIDTFTPVIRQREADPIARDARRHLDEQTT